MWVSILKGWEFGCQKHGWGTATAALLSKRSLSVGRAGQDSPEQEPMSLQASLVQSSRRVTSYLQAASSRFCLFQKSSDEIRLRPTAHRPWVSGGQWCSHREGAMRGRCARRIAEHQGTRGLDVLSGVWGAHNEVSPLGKSHPSHVWPVRSRSTSGPGPAPPARMAGFIPSGKTTQCEEPTSLL